MSYTPPVTTPSNLGGQLAAWCRHSEHQLYCLPCTGNLIGFSLVKLSGVNYSSHKNSEVGGGERFTHNSLILSYAKHPNSLPVIFLQMYVFICYLCGGILFYHVEVCNFLFN